MDIKSEEETSNEQINSEKLENNQEEASDSPTSDTENKPAIDSLLHQSVILEGKRSRKPTLRLELFESSPAKKELLIPQGHGKPLGEIAYINYQITHASTDALSRMRTICFDRRGNKTTIRKHLREFKGFEFNQNSDEYQKHLSNLTKLKRDQLRSISNILGLPSTGRNTDHAERILNFLVKPIDEGKKVPRKKSAKRNIKKQSTHSVQTDPETNGKSEAGSDYHFKPGKKSTKKRESDQENSPTSKRTKSNPINGNDSSIEGLTNKTVENGI